MITLAKTAGFCFGVNRAVSMVEKLADEGKRVCTLGPIIHNEQLVSALAEKGVRVISEPEEAGKEDTLVIRSHGVPAEIFSRARKTGATVVDATCPFVAKIHSIVREHSNANSVILIAGDKKHHEVIGICGNAQSNTPTFVFSDKQELENLIENHPEFSEKQLIAVSQTTFNAEIWNECQKILKKSYTNALIFDTICNATAMRQQEADSLSKVNECMIVIGGRHSSNTAKLFDVCSANCRHTYFISTAKDLREEMYKDKKSIGVVAGASTPAHIIKEVIKTMSENLQSVEQVEEAVQKSFEEMTDEEAFEASLSALTGDQKVIGTVLAVSENEIQVDIGRGLAGYISKEEYSSNPDADILKEVSVGDTMNLIIMRTNDQEGTVMLSKRRFDAIAGWDNIVAAKESGEILTGIVKDVIKGGITVYSNGIRVFIPASQATLSRNESLEELKGKEVRFQIIEIGRGRRAVGSIRNILKEERKAAAAKVWETIAVGDRFTGTVKSLTNYGAFVDLGGVDGMVHISELSWQRIKNPSEVVLVGDTVEVYVKAIDNEKKKISLGYKKPEENPWVIFEKNFEVDDTVKVTVVSMTTYGAFARIIPGIDGLIHISQIANKHVAKPQDELSVGQEVEAKIIAVDYEKKRVSLSIRALLPEEEAAPVEEAVEATEEVVEAPAEETVTEEAAE
ncbi:MAG: bifunctional 4-hydroxy-3-methylbut-2-enyl diphosphate reductase/30S ribosomal protein S1, partial [Acutalibacteraceae bacterium]|nr:bifunctional 4-hydroxy-3-methylbut-2-enyl diphosphate reductase/30S ribosomal protein S1 [Acutalibacteraceae bacterium]